jgi:hypothetical protein
MVSGLSRYDLEFWRLGCWFLSGYPAFIGGKFSPPLSFIPYMEKLRTSQMESSTCYLEQVKAASKAFSE